MKRIILLSALLLPILARASGVAALGDIACGIYTNTASVGIPYVQNSWLNDILHTDWGISYVPDWWTDYSVQISGAVENDSAAATMGQLKWCVRQTTALLDNVATNVGGAGDWLRWTAGNLPSSGNDEAVTVADFATLVEPVVARVRQLEIDSMYSPADSFPEINNLFSFGVHSNELVSLAHLKSIFNFDPELDSYPDGIPDWWQRYYGLISWHDEYGSNGDPDADFDWDGLTDYEEWRRGTDPTNRDEDGDGLVDGVDPDPRSWTDPGDYDQDGVPDALETHWFGGTDVVGSSSDLDWAGFPFAMALAAGLCPTNPPPGTTYPTNGVASLPLVPRFGLEAVSGETVWEVSFDLPRHGAWEQYFLAVTPDPYSDPGTCPSPFSGLSLKWTAQGASGTLAFPAPGYVVPVPVPPGAPNDSSFEITLRLVATQTGLVSCPSPLYFLSYAPALEFPGAPAAMAGGARVSAAVADSDIPFSVDWSLAPAEAAPPADYSDELVFALFGASFATFTRDEIGRISGGTLCGVPAGVYEFPFIAPPPSRTVPPEIRRILLAVVNPRLAYGNGHGPNTAGIAWDPATGSYARTSEYPLDTEDLWRPFHSDATGCFACDCAPVLTVGIPSEYESLFATNVAVYPSGLRQSATGTVFFAGAPLCVLGADHDPWSAASVATDGLDASCECDGGEVDGDSEGSVRFRLSLGQPRAGQYSGFLWFRSDGPVAVTPQLFELLARSDASVSDATAGGVRTIACSDARGRTVVVSPIADGVRLAVTNTATGEPDHFWTIVNENGSTSRIRFVRTSRAGNVQSDRTYALSGGVWSVSDNVAGTTETLVRTDALDDRVCPTSSVERVLCDSSGLELSHTFVSSRRYGEGANAVLRETERREDVGTFYEKASFATYWETGGKRFGLPRLVSGNARAWSWTDYDSRGRPILVFDQRDGAPCPADGTGWTFASHPASLKAFATVHSYAPLAGDSNHPDDDDTPRTTSRYVVEGASSNLISRTWTVMTHGTTSGHPSVSVRTERAASQSATFGDSANAVSVSVSVDPEASGVPLLLRGRPLSYTDEDGVATTYEYAFGTWDEATRTFAAGGGSPSGGAGGQSAPEGVSHLRTRVFTTTPEAPTGVPLVSTVSETVEDAVHGNEVWSATRVLLANGALSDPFDWEARTYDEQDRLRSTLYSDGSSSTNAYSCCRLLFTVGRDGQRRDRLADTGSDHLRHAWLDVSFPSLPQNCTTSGDYAEPGAYRYHRPYSFRAVESLFDPLGREIRRRELATEPNRSSSISTLRASNNAWESVETNFYPFGTSDSGVRIDARGLRTERNVYHYASSVETWTESYDGTNLLDRAITSSTRGGGFESFRLSDGAWTDTRSFSRYGSDGCRTDYSVTEASDSPVVTNSVVASDFLGRTMRVTTPLSDSTYAYDGASSRAVSVSDAVSGLSTATLYDALREPVGSISAGVSSLSNTRYELISNAWWRVTETRESAGAQTNLLSTVRERLTGLSDSLRSEVVSIPAGGAVSTTTVSFDPATLVSVSTNLVDGLAPLVVRSKFGRVFETQERDGTLRRSYFDPYGRVYLTGDQAPGGTFLWRTWTLRDEKGDAFADVEVTARGLAAIGLASSRSGFLQKQLPTNNNYTKWSGLVRQYAYDARGSLVETWDQEGHATVHERDGLGRIVHTYGATYPAARLFDTAGRLVGLGTTRAGTAWDATFWGYDAATGLCTNKTYADGTCVRHTFAPDGLPLRTTLASGAWTQNAYDAYRRVSSVTTSDHYDDYNLSYDGFGRVSEAEDGSARYVFERDAIGRVTNELCYTGRPKNILEGVLSRSRDASGRPAATSLAFWDDFRQSTCYDWGMDGNLAGMTISNAQGRALEVCYAWEDGRLQGYDISDGGRWPVFSRWNVRAPRRPALVTSCESGADGGDVRSFSYAYDAVGLPVERDSDAFAYNARGEVTNAVLDGAAYRYAYDAIGNRAVSYAAGATTLYAANNVNQYTAVGSAQPSYDADGNLVDDGTRTYDWSAVGHLNEAAGPSVRLAFEYDHLGRRVSRVAETRSGNTWHISEERFFAYDGWNLVHETRSDSGGAETDIEYFWGPDLSGSLQGAGGVGGLVAVSIDGDFYFPGYDNNGNVIGYWNEDGDLVAEYAYDAFGNTIASSGTMADVFPHRFSTKYYDAETDLYYYGYRYYAPSLGRWISRDPIGEDGGLNLVSFCNNGPLSVFDYLGTLIIVFSGGGGNDTADVVADTQNKFESAKNDIETFAKNIEKYVSEDRYSDLQTLNKVSFNDISFPGTRTQYLEKIRREKQSFFQPCVDNSIDAYIRRIATSAARYVREPYDMVGVSIHGQENSTATAPTGMVVLEGPAGQDIIPQIAFYRQLSGVLSRIKFSGQLVIVSCFQEYHTSYPSDVQKDAQMMSATTEQFSYLTPDFYPKLKSIEKFKERAFCALRFTPFSVSKKVGNK